MTHDHVQPLNYSAHAIEDLLKLAEGYRSMGAPQSAFALTRMTELLQQSVKFILPNGCNLVEPNEIRQAHLDLAYLPFPVVAFEAPWEKDDGVEALGGLTQFKAPRRIALCWEAKHDHEVLPGSNAVFDTFPDGGVFVVPIYWTPAFASAESPDPLWQTPLGGAFVPHDASLQKIEAKQMAPASQVAMDALIDSGRGKFSALQFRSEPFVLLPELFEMLLRQDHHGNRDAAMARIIMDTHDEVYTLVAACSVINCANVATVDLPAPAALNKKRAARGKQPFFSYKVLQIAEEKHHTTNGAGGGTHASPRMHLRRGHLRRLENKVVWVRNAMVNAGTPRGVVMKDYAVPASPVPPNNID